MQQPPLIVGAGPVGLAAALFLARRGIVPRVIEKRPHRSHESRALAVNPRTLDLLEQTGVTARMLELGAPMRGAQFWPCHDHHVEANFNELHARHPFMLALSQSVTERLLEEAFEAAGGRVERNRELVACESHDNSAHATIRDTDGTTEELDAPWLLAADGAHSTTRKSLDIDFPGAAMPHDWYLADLPLETTLAIDRAHGLFLEHGAFVFYIRVVTDARADHAPHVWRVISNRPITFDKLPHARAAGEPIWSSSFRVAHRLAATFRVGRAFLAGDAAHIHSPIGARGMNLGIEDAAVFAALIATDRVDEYESRRRPVDDAVVRRVRIISSLADADSAVLRIARRFAPQVFLNIAPVRRRIVRTVAGLDHPLPPEVATPPA